MWQNNYWMISKYTLKNEKYFARICEINLNLVIIWFWSNNAGAVTHLTLWFGSRTIHSGDSQDSKLRCTPRTRTLCHSRYCRLMEFALRQAPRRPDLARWPCSSDADCSLSHWCSPDSSVSPRTMLKQKADCNWQQFEWTIACMLLLIAFKLYSIVIACLHYSLQFTVTVVVEFSQFHARVNQSYGDCNCRG